MTSSFNPPSRDRLAEVDSTDCEYHSQCEDILGIVSERGQGVVNTVHLFFFSAWRRIGQPLVNNELTILRPVAADDDWSAPYPPLSIHRIGVLLSKDQTRAIFANAVAANVDDAELMAVAEELQKPVLISTKLFGDLWLDASLGWFEGEAEWNGEPIDVHFHADDGGSIDRGIDVAEALWKNQQQWKRKVEDFAVSRLLALKNEAWLPDDEKHLTPEQFKSRMTLQSISFAADGSFEFWHDDGDLFWGHSIQISGSLQDGLTQADIPG
jgi:hypothetical protein